MTDTAMLAIAGLLAAAAVIFTAQPFLRRAARRSHPSAPEHVDGALTEERDRALAALKELEFDHRTGKVTDEDYRGLVLPLRRQAAEILARLEPEHARPARARHRPRTRRRARAPRAVEGRTRR